MASSSSSSPEISPSGPVARSFSYKDATKEEVLEDLSSRFILNLPDEELTSLERLCFQVEQAHWFYEDFIREQNNKLPSLPLKKFSEMLFRACPLLNKWSDSHEQAFNDFMQYKTRVPVCGAIMLNAAMDKCVLVKGWKASSGWGFPKGKINQTEPEVDCAVREVLEETGYNLADQIDPKNVLNFSIREQKIFLYIVPGVPEDFPFETKTRKEISKIQWFNLADLPTWKKNKSTPGRFYLISPFISGLKAFINQNRPRNNPRKNGKQRKVHPETSQQSSETHYQKVDAQAETTQSQPSSSLDSVLDPHMSRLLSSLTLSATSQTNNTQNTPRDINGQPVNALPPSPRHSNTSGDSPVVPHFSEQSDWSSSFPANFNLQPIELPKVKSDTSMTHESSASVAASQVKVNGSLKNIEPIFSIPSHSNTSPNACAASLSAPFVNVAPSATPSSQPVASPTSPTSRRAASTADISPYLSRASAVPTSAKRLQQLSLLESVANESEKLAPILAARAAMVSRGPNGPQLAPQPPPDSNAAPGHLRDAGIMYSSIQPSPASAAGFHGQPQGHLGPGFHDPFQVRARTSQAFHRPTMHNATGSVSMNQSQLLATINAPRFPLQGPGSQAPQYMHNQMRLQQHNNPSQYYPPQANLQYPVAQPFINGSNAFSNNILPPPPPQPSVPLNGFLPYVNGVPNGNPSMNLNASMGPAAGPINPTTVSLLSILNGRPSQQINPSAQLHR